ncbi:hypothetical protein [Corynebacterium sp. NML130628]|uniref:hypothetical protein n=1 Tax=Corynebacterium sp. NML130628 TaxID=1906333 RepID=UPI0008FB4DA9|nr:hypothetical protein [Corynebacterium sp. NML130628]OIR46156.1 hypothetical protein BJP07_01675 [Corynebacterium sp. NML130628]
MTEPNTPENDPQNPGGIPSYPEYGASPYGQPSGQSYGEQLSEGQADFGAFDVNSAAQASGQSALRYHGAQLAVPTSPAAAMLANDDGFVGITPAQYGDGVTPHPISNPALNGVAHQLGTGKLSVGAALKYGFKTAYANPGTWLVLAFVYALLNTIGGVFQSDGVSALGALVLFFAAPLFIAAALQQTLVGSKQFVLKDIKSAAYGKTLGMTVVVGIITSLILFVLMAIGLVAGFAGADPEALLNASGGDLSAIDPSAFATLFVGMGIAVLIMLFISPFFIFQSFYAADNNGTFGDAFKAGFASAKRNYGSLLGLMIVCGILMSTISGGGAATGVAAFVSLVLGTLLTAPALLAMVYAYRQVSGGPVPHEVAVA